MAFVPSGKDSNAKVIKYTATSVEGSEQLYVLTNRHASLLLTMTEYLRWLNRWRVLPPEITNQDELDAYVSDLELRLMMVVNYCSQIINCLLNDEDTKQALVQLINEYVPLQEVIAKYGNGGGIPSGETPLPDSVQITNIIGERETCELDNLWGSIITFIEWLHMNNEDFLDRIAVATTPAARSAALSGEIPGFQGGVIGDALSVAITFISGALVDGYDAAYSSTYRDELACELFCYASQHDCEININTIYRVLSKRIGYQDTLHHFYNGFVFAVTGEWTGSNLADVMFFIQIGSMALMGGFGDYVGLNPLMNAISLGWDNPSDDWETLCDPCPVTCTEIIDFSHSFDGQILNIGTSDSAGYMFSAELPTPPVTQYTQVFMEHDVSDLIMMRFIVDQQRNYAVAANDDGGNIGTNLDVTAYYENPGEYAVELPVVPNSNPTTLVDLTFRNLTGVNTPFRLLRIELISNC